MMENYGKLWKIMGNDRKCLAILAISDENISIYKQKINVHTTQVMEKIKIHTNTDYDETLVDLKSSIL